MSATTTAPVATGKEISAWTGFRPGLWQKEIEVRDFIQQNYTPYDGEASFLAGPTERTQRIQARLNELFIEERRKGVLASLRFRVRSPRTLPAI